MLKRGRWLCGLLAEGAPVLVKGSFFKRSGLQASKHEFPVLVHREQWDVVAGTEATSQVCRVCQDLLSSWGV